MQAAWIIDQLILQGVTTFCIAPGSRSVPLALAASEHPQAETIVHFDERGLGFYALGCSKARKTPTAIIVTSGTAIANLFPAILEAFYSHTPLVILTADRPHELRSCGANQTLDQVKIFGTGVHFTQDLSPHLEEKAIRSIVAQAVFQSLVHQGPIHLNCPFQEPLYKGPSLFTKARPVEFVLPQRSCLPRKETAQKGVILLGPVTDPAPVLKMAERLQWPVFADLLSQARRTLSQEQIVHFDFLSSPLEKEVDLVLHIGGRFISKKTPSFARHAPLLHIHPFDSLEDPERRVNTRVLSEIASFCETFEATANPNWLKAWKEEDGKMESILRDKFLSPFTEAHAILQLQPEHPIFFGNSMPIRHADHFFFPKKCPQIFANRGLSGIDGNIATAAGIAHGCNTPLIAFLGDQTTLHDLNSFPLLKKHKILLIISNNGGGAIFDYLPISGSEHVDKICTASHNWSFVDAAKMFDLPYMRVEGPLTFLPEYGIIELVTQRKMNRAFSL